MSIKNVTVVDLALVELLDSGKTDAPREVLAKLRDKGYVTTANRSAKLTTKGRDRAQRLKPFERTMRLMFVPGTTGSGASPVKTVGGSEFCI